MQQAKPVLIVDDNVELAENIKELLEDEGVNADIAASGEDALVMLAQSEYALVVTDMRMPGMSGLDLVRAIRNQSPRIQVVVMTAYTSDEILDEAQAEGALASLSKPIDLRRFLPLVERLLAGKFRVLVLEDDAALRAGLTEALLEDEGEVVPYPAPTLALARRLASEVDFSVAVVDLRLPDGDGLSLRDELSEAGAPLPVIVISGYPEEARERLPPGGLATYLEKPFPPARLIQAIKQAAR